MGRGGVEAAFDYYILLGFKFMLTKILLYNCYILLGYQFKLTKRLL